MEEQVREKLRALSAEAALIPTSLLDEFIATIEEEDYLESLMDESPEKGSVPLILIEKEFDEKCVICYELVTKFFQFHCTHEFCQDCCTKLVTSEVVLCPLCRKSQQVIDARRVLKIIARVLLRKKLEEFLFSKQIEQKNTQSWTWRWCMIL